MSRSATSATFSRDTTGVLRALVQLTKPSITRMVLVTTAAGAFSAPGAIDIPVLCFALVGTALVVGAANGLNMVLERDVDALMARTADRPLPTGRTTPEAALCFSLTLAASGLLLLVARVNATSALLAAVALVTYVLLYTPLKRVTPYALHVGAIPGAIPPLIGWVSVTGSLSLGAVSLFAILLVWQLPHFLAISLFRRRDYASAGLRVYALARGPEATRRAIVFYAVLLLAVGFAPLLVGLGGWLYALCAGMVGLVFLGVTVSGLFRKLDERWGRTVFLATLPHLVIVYGSLVLAQI